MDEIDILIAVSLLPPTSAGLINDLGMLPGSNPFSGTTQVMQTGGANLRDHKSLADAKQATIESRAGIRIKTIARMKDGKVVVTTTSVEEITRKDKHRGSSNGAMASSCLVIAALFGVAVRSKTKQRQKGQGHGHDDLGDTVIEFEEGDATPFLFENLWSTNRTEYHPEDPLAPFYDV